MAAESGVDGEAEDRAAEARCSSVLAALGVATRLHRHPPLFTVEDSKALRGELPGVHVKNMFLKDQKSGALWLVTCLEDRRFKIRDIEPKLGVKKVSFGKPDLLWAALGVRPGAVTPLAVINDAERRVSLAIDAALPAAELVNCHPLHNRATLALSGADLSRLFAHTGHRPTVIDFDALPGADDRDA